jgi:hypothetical protein
MATTREQPGTIPLEGIRDQLHALIDQVPDERLEEALLTVQPLTYPLDDEPLTEEERASIAEARISHLRGESVPHEEAMRRAGLR